MLEINQWAEYRYRRGSLNVGRRVEQAVANMMAIYINGQRTDDYIEPLELMPHEDDIEVVWVPGAFEIPVMAQKMAQSKKYDAIICLGAVIKGSTSHYDYVCAEVSKGIASVSLQFGLPVMFGVLTTDNIEQAIERAGTKAGNKGYDCAMGALEMVSLLKGIK